MLRHILKLLGNSTDWRLVTTALKVAVITSFPTIIINKATQKIQDKRRLITEKKPQKQNYKIKQNLNSTKRVVLICCRRHRINFYLKVYENKTNGRTRINRNLVILLGIFSLN